MKNDMDGKLFYAGYCGVRSFRIPSLLYTKKGTLIAAVDARIQEGCDNPNRIDKVIRRSFDKGSSWSSMITALQMQGEGRKGCAAIDPCMLYDEQSERIFLFYCYSPAGIGLQNANMGTGFDERGRKLLYDRQDNVYYMEEQEPAEHESQDTASEDSLDRADGFREVRPVLRVDESKGLDGYLTDRNGEITRDGRKCGNIRLSGGELREFPTCYLQYIYSDDEGTTWSEPVDVTSQVKAPWMRFIGPGPGRGIVKKRGACQGRYLIPVYYSNAYGLLSAAVVYSDDQGMSWHMGASPNDVRCAEESRLVIDQEDSLQEMQLVELQSGTIRAFIRNTMPEEVICYADSTDGGETWTAPEPLMYLRNPVCMLSAVGLHKEDDQILLSGPWHKKERINGTVLCSTDGGLTAESVCRITEGGFGYSCLAQLDEDSVAILYEVDNGTPVIEEIRFRVLSLSRDFHKV